MSDPLDPLKQQQPYSGGAPASEPLEPPPKGKLDDAGLVAGGIGLIIGSLLTGNYALAAKVFTFGTSFAPIAKPPFLKPTPLTGIALLAPLPFGYQKSAVFGLRENYIGRFFEHDLGMSRPFWIEARMLATHRDSPAIEARFHDYMRMKFAFYYERKAIDLSLAELRSDYELFTRASRGELGHVPVQLDVAKLAETAAELYNTKLAHLEYLNLGAIQTYINPPLLPVPPRPAPTATLKPVLPQIGSAAGPSDYGADPTNPLPPIPTGTSQRPADPSSMFQQEAADNAPRALKQNVFSRRDP